VSRQTMNWLNTNTLIGFAEKRGKAWHYRAEEQGDESNHYDGAIPVEDVRRRLFHWKAEPRPLYVGLPADVTTATGFTAESELIRHDQVPGRVAITRSDNGFVMSCPTTSYAIHQYDEWLLDTVSLILDDDLHIGSAGLLAQGGIAWVSVEVPENITTPEGVVFRPNLLACTAHNGSMSTTYKRVVQNVVCDNTMAIALREDGQEYRVRHTAGSIARLGEARDALAVIHTIADEFAAEVAALTARPVTPVAWNRFLDAYAPSDPSAGKRAQNAAADKRQVLNEMWQYDPRVAPWAGTAWGAVQAVNTYYHHEVKVRGNRGERNMTRALTGEIDKLDTGSVALLNRVLA
jgi:phage/plasmid-like protein (TIGR03299 family)